MTLNVKIKDHEIVGTVTKPIRIPLKRLTDYLIEHGFENDGVWYFRHSWMRQEDIRVFTHLGLVEKVGSVEDLRNRGIRIHESLNYSNQSKGTPILYRVIDDKINCLMEKK